MAKEIVRHGEDYEIEYAGDAFIGPPRSVLKVNGTDGTMTMGNITIGPDGKAQFDGAAVDEANLPTASQKAALAGTDGTPSGTDKYVTNSDARNTNARTPTAHKTSHQDGGADEIVVTGLSGLLADAQTALAHAASHLPGGLDALSNISYSPATPSNWAGTAPDDVKEALDRIAVVLKALNGGTGA